MALAPGSRIGVYEITTQIGEGGMGQVYRAIDTKLKRQIAIKILPPTVAGDADRLARFQREAEVLASLNHPNIAGIYGLEESPDVTALVMELVEGEDLSHRIARGAIPIDEALPIAKQIAEALEAAHEQGIIHRDLKPANIKVRRDGTVKVLDFGLAKAMEPSAASSPSMSMSPTITTPGMTQAGMILGTAAYMSPEQARGRTVDKRADIWAFGVVLFEMLTATRAFGADDVSLTLARVLEREPDFSKLPSSVPAHITQAIRLCLQKNLKQRMPDIAAMRLALEGAFETSAPQSTSPATAAPARMAWMTVLAGAAVIVAIGLAIPAVRYLRQTPPSAPPETRVDIVTPATSRPTDFALSPDGSQIVYVASGDAASRLWLRSLATPTAVPLMGTESATYPFWAPNGRSVAFFAGGALKRLDLGGGAPRTLTPAPNFRGGTWSADGVIVFGSAFSPLMRVSATGGAATPVTTLGPQHLLTVGHRWPWFLPDGRRFLSLDAGSPDTAGVYVGALDGTQKRLTPTGEVGFYLSSHTASEGGWLLWVREGALVAQRLSADNTALTGEPITLADGVAADGLNRGAVSVATTGLIAYRTGVASKRQLTWVDRAGVARGTIGDPDDRTLDTPRVSPDGRHVVVARRVEDNYDLWLLDGRHMSRLTFDPGNERFPVWSPDGTRLAFRVARPASTDLYQQVTSGTGNEERLLASDQSKSAASWSPDGRFLLYWSNDPQSGADLWVLPMVGEHTPSVFLKTPFREVYGTFSPDGRWVAYQSNESGRDEVYVRPFVPPGAGDTAPVVTRQWQVSTTGGITPAWRPDGKELYYLDTSGAMMAAAITITGTTLEPGTPVTLFATRVANGGIDIQQGRQFDVAPDGRFLINTELATVSGPITLIQNWHPEAKQ